MFFRTLGARGIQQNPSRFATHISPQHYHTFEEDFQLRLKVPFFVSWAHSGSITMLLPLLGFTLVVVYFLLDRYFMPKHAVNEPPLFTSPIPYIGHLIGLWRHGSLYYRITRYMPSSIIHGQNHIKR